MVLLCCYKQIVQNKEDFEEVVILMYVLIIRYNINCTIRFYKSNLSII